MTQLQRRVTDVPYEDIRWFQEHDRTSRDRARELARAELTARRDGYVIRWVHPWICQLDDPDDGEKLLASADWIVVDGSPVTDPRAREVEQQLAREAGLKPPGLPDAGRIRRDGNVLRWEGDGYGVFWEHVWVCQLFEPDGRTLIDESDAWGVDPATSPLGRIIAADLAHNAGV
jgi:hypothetical protein